MNATQNTSVICKSMGKKMDTKPQSPFDNLSTLEQAFYTRWLQMGNTAQPMPHYRFHDQRKWATDFAWPALKVAVEMEGGTFTGGGHVRGVGYAANCEKYNTMAELGWVVLRYTTDMLDKDPEAVISQVIRVIELRAAEIQFRNEALRVMIRERGEL